MIIMEVENISFFFPANFLNRTGKAQGGEYEEQWILRRGKRQNKQGVRNIVLIVLHNFSES